MKVLFAVNNEEISESIVKKYQRKYKEIISYKNVYYFNAILKEIQKDKSYDRIVVSEDLEQFTNTSYEQMDKFIFEKLDSISDEASNVNSRDIPIILICTERRTKSEDILVKLFGIGIYNAIIGNDRSIDEVCRLIYQPRLKKDAKTYYKINSDNVSYKAENENDVSEVEIQNILAHFKRLGKNESKYVESYNNIATQYNDNQLKIISKFLPLGVRAVLEEKSPKYQQVMAFNKAVSENLRKKKIKQNGLSEKLLVNPKKTKVLDNPIVVPSSMSSAQNAKKLTRITNPRPSIQENFQEMSQQNRPQNIQRTSQTRVQQNVQEIPQPKELQNSQRTSQTRMQQNVQRNVRQQLPIENNNELDYPQEDKLHVDNYSRASIPQNEEVVQQEIEKPKRRRGRPRKNPLPEEIIEKPKRGRGRPRKNILSDEIEDNSEIEEEVVLPGMEQIDNNNIIPQNDMHSEPIQKPQNNIYSELDEDIYEDDSIRTSNEETYNQDIKLPQDDIYDEPIEQSNEGLQTDKYEENVDPYYQQNNDQLYDDSYINQENNIQYQSESNEQLQQPSYQLIENNQGSSQPKIEQLNIGEPENNYTYSSNSHVDISDLLQGNKKIAIFVGTSKNGTSFIVNNLAEMLSSVGVNVAILDTTRNRNSYYIYTKNEEELRKTAMSSITNLSNGVANGIRVNSNLVVYTSLPNENMGIENVQTVLETLAKSHTVVLIDSDFYTPRGYFSAAQEVYLVQTMDILTIQPLTAFLKELVAQNIIEEQNIRIIINKYLKIRGVSEKEIIGGMAYYNDPAMTYQTGLFDKALVKYMLIPFEEETYVKYLQGLINCEISLKGYSKIFMQGLRQLGNMVYPVLGTGKGNYRPPALGNNNFSSNMNNTLDQMKRNY